jgi:two-component system, LytTR family, sensor kinase
MKHPLSRKKIYIVLLALDVLTSIERLFLFPDQGWFFHVSLFFATFVMVALLWEGILKISTALEKKFTVSENPLSRIILQVFFTFIIAWILGEIMFSNAEKYFNVNSPDLLDKIAPLLFLLSSIILNLVYFGAYYFKEWKENLVKAERLQREQAEVKYDVLRNQLNPHFLFNALTSLNSLIFENQQLASDFLQQLSKVYRYTLQNRDKTTVSLRTELNFIDHYIFLFKTRFGDAIRFNVTAEEQALEKGIVPVTLQLLIENAVKHNVANQQHPLTISITTNNGYLSIANSVHLKSQVESSNGLGLENLKALYHYLDNRPVVIEQTSNTFTVKIPLAD